MFSTARVSATSATRRAFSTTVPRGSDVSKLILVGRLGGDPITRTTKNEKEYVAYSVGTRQYPPPPPAADGTTTPSRTTWHHVVSFNPNANSYLRTLQKGSSVYVEANFELREADPTADPASPQGQKQIFLRHESIRVLQRPKPVESSESSTNETSI